MTARSPKADLCRRVVHQHLVAGADLDRRPARRRRAGCRRSSRSRRCRAPRPCSRPISQAPVHGALSPAVSSSAKAAALVGPKAARSSMRRPVAGSSSDSRPSSQRVRRKGGCDPDRLELALARQPAQHAAEEAVGAGSAPRRPGRPCRRRRRPRAPSLAILEAERAGLDRRPRDDRQRAEPADPADGDRAMVQPDQRRRTEQRRRAGTGDPGSIRSPNSPPLELRPPRPSGAAAPARPMRRSSSTCAVPAAPAHLRPQPMPGQDAAPLGGVGDGSAASARACCMRHGRACGHRSR